MKIVTVCEEGVNRSVAAKWLIQFRNWDGHQEHELISMGINCLRPESRDMLYAWAERIILLDARFTEGIPKDKLIVWDVGPDHFFRGFHPELIETLMKLGWAPDWPPVMEVPLAAV